MSGRRTERIVMRCTPAFKARAEDRAQAAGMSLSAFIEQCVEPVAPVLGQALADPAGSSPSPGLCDDSFPPPPPGRHVPSVPARASGNGNAADHAAEATQSVGDVETATMPTVDVDRVPADAPGLPSRSASLPPHGSPSPSLTRWMKQKGAK